MLPSSRILLSQTFLNLRQGTRSFHTFTTQKISNPTTTNQLIRSSFRSAPLRQPLSSSGGLLLSRFCSSSAKKVAEGGEGTIKSTANAIQESYSTSLSILHWLGAIGFIGCTISGYVATTIPWDKKKTTPEKFQFKLDLMHYHKSVGLLMLGLMVPRLAVRLATKIPAAPPGPAWEKIAGEASHYALYGCMIFMPVSGVIFGYLGGKGLPFFNTKIPGASKEVAEKAKPVTGFFFQWHKRVGTVLEYLIPLHVSASIFHYLFRGQNLLKRISPFAKKASSS